MKILCSRLGEKAGMKLEAGADIAGMSVVLRVDNLPAKEVMDKIAGTAVASWVRLGENHYRLQRTKEDRQKIWDQHIKYRSERFATAVRNYVKAAKPSETVDLAGYSSLVRAEQELLNDRTGDRFEKLRRAEAFMKQRPFGKFLAELFRRIDPKSVAEIAPYSYRIYTNQPTSLEYPFTEDVRSLLAAFVSAQDILLQAQAGAGLGPDTTSSEPVDKIAVEISRFDAATDYHVRILGWYRSGALCLDHSSGNLEYAPYDSTVPYDSKLEYKIDDLTKSYARNYYFQPYAKDVPALSAEQVSRLWKPTQHDPVSLCYGPQLLACAEVLERNLIAIPTDLELSRGAWLINDRKVATMIHRAAYGPSWITIVPADMSEYDAAHLDRVILEELLKTVGKSTLQSAFELARKFPWPTASTCIGGYASMLKLPLIVETANPLQTLFYGSLSAGQRATLERGGKLMPFDLNAEQRGLLARWLTRRPETLLVPIIDLRERGARFPADYKGPLFLKGNSTVPQQLRQMPSTTLANGLPPFEISSKSEATVLALVRNSQGEYFRTAREVAFLLRNREGSRTEDPASFQLWNSSLITLEVAFGDLTVAASLTDRARMTSEEFVAFDQLPASFRAEVEKAKLPPQDP